MTAPKIEKPSLFACLNCKLPAGKDTAQILTIDQVSLVSQTNKLTIVSASICSIVLPGEVSVDFVGKPILQIVACINEKNKAIITTFWIKDQMPSTRNRSNNPDGSITCEYTVEDNEGRGLVISQNLPGTPNTEVEKSEPALRRKISQTSCGAIAKAKQMQIEQDESGMFICKLIGRGGKLTLVTDCHGAAIRNRTERELARRILAVNPKIALAAQI